MKKFTTYIFLIFTISSCALMSDDPVIPQQQQHEDGLPIIYIHPIPPGKETFTNITLYFKGKKYKAKGKVRGSASLSYPKKNYTIKFEDNDLFTFNDNIKNKKKINLSSNFDDVSYIRTRLAFSLWDKLDNKFKVDTGSCIVYMNGKYHGLYTIIERIDDDLIKEHAEEGIINQGGNLYKGTSRDSNFSINKNKYNFFLQEDDLAEDFEKKSGFPEAGNEGAFSDLENMIKSINTTENITNFMEKTFHMNDFYSWFSFTSYINATDSMRNNCYYYHDLSTDKWYFIPWDFNASFGRSVRIYSTTTTNPYSYSQHNMIFKSISESETLSNKYNLYNNEKLTGSNESCYRYDQLNTLVDSFYSEIEAAAIKDSKHWEKERKEHYGSSSKNFDFEVEIEFLKKWIKDQNQSWINYYK